MRFQSSLLRKSGETTPHGFINDKGLVFSTTWRVVLKNPAGDSMVDKFTFGTPVAISMVRNHISDHLKEINKGVDDKLMRAVSTDRKKQLLAQRFSIQTARGWVTDLDGYTAADLTTGEWLRAVPIVDKKDDPPPPPTQPSLNIPEE